MVKKEKSVTYCNTCLGWGLFIIEDNRVSPICSYEIEYIKNPRIKQRYPWKACPECFSSPDGSKIIRKTNKLNKGNK